MIRRAPLALPAALLALALGACGKDDKNTTVDSVAVTASQASVYANGTNTVTLSVTASAGPVTVRTSKGTFAGGGTTVTLAGATGDVVLTTCNAATDTACAGTARVTAIHGSAIRTLDITFGGLELCSANCNTDANCASHACALAAGGTGTCSGTPPSAACAAPACVASQPGGETTCDDGLDNDCDQQIDCADTGCSGRACKPGSPTFLCQGTGAAAACVDVSSGAGIGLVASRTRLPPDGTNTSLVTATVTQGGSPAAGVGVTFTTDLGTFTSSGTATATANTDAEGRATVTYRAGATPGTATIRASMTSLPVVTATVVATLPAIGSIQLGAVEHQVMGVKDSGFREINALTVTVFDDQNVAYPDGLRVHFEHVQLGGSLLNGTPPNVPVVACATPAGCVAYDAVTDASGIARVGLVSGTVAGTLSVTATASAGGDSRNFTIPSVAVIGAKANGANFSIVCSPRNVPALAETNCSTSNVDTQFTCEALLKDRFNNLLGTATQVTFVAEAAAVGQVATTVAYNPSQPPTSQGNLGVATQIFKTLGAGLPFDVPPVAGEPRAVHGLDSCGTRTHNPRDGILTVIAIADGEEAFFDANGNGRYDLGEPFIDLGEPFVDQDDNGQWDTGEWFLNVNQNDGYDGPNGVWDATAKLWTQTVVVYTGVPVGPLSVPEPFTDTDGNGTWSAAEPFTDTNANGAWDAGEPFTDVNANGSRDAAEAFTDVNGNGVWDASGAAWLGSRWADLTFAGACAPSRAPQAFAVNAPVAGPPPIPATSMDRVAVASDMNLNLLTSATTYAATTAAPGRVVTTYRGLGTLANQLGFFYQYWPCDQSGACASQCRATGAGLPCVMRPAITDYGCGYAADVTMTGGSPADGGNVVDWRVITTYPTLNQSNAYNLVLGIAGTNN